MQPRTDVSIPQLVGQVYESAPTPEKIRLLEHLLRPLGVLTFVAVANGAFAKIWFWSRGQTLHVRPEDLQSVAGSDVTALVAFIEQFSADTVDGIAQVVSASPVLAGAGVSALLVAALLKRRRARATRA